MESASSQRRDSDAEQSEGGLYVLYADNEIKNEFVFKTELFEPQDIKISMEDTLNESNEEDPWNQIGSEARIVPECTHARPGKTGHCNKCLEEQFGLSLKNNLVKHKQDPVDVDIHTDPVDTDIYTCKSCHMTFDTESSLQNHGRKQLETANLYKDNVNRVISNGRTFYMCDICGENFVQKGSLMCHFATHARGSESNRKYSTFQTELKNKSYSCNECKKICVSTQALARHKRIHSEVKHAVHAIFS